MAEPAALLIIDVQTGMFHESDPVHQGERLLSTLETLIAKARATEIPVVYIQHNERPGRQLATGTPHWEIHERIAPQAHDLVIQKHTPDSFHQTTLHDELTARGIKRLLLSGIQSDMCVDTTCRRAFSLGYDVTLIEDAHSTWGSESLTADLIIGHHNRTLRWFADVTPSRDIQF